MRAFFSAYQHVNLTLSQIQKNILTQHPVIAQIVGMQLVVRLFLKKPFLQTDLDNLIMRLEGFKAQHLEYVMLSMNRVFSDWKVTSPEALPTQIIDLFSQATTPQALTECFGDDIFFKKQGYHEIVLYPTFNELNTSFYLDSVRTVTPNSKKPPGFWQALPDDVQTKIIKILVGDVPYQLFFKPRPFSTQAPTIIKDLVLGEDEQLVVPKKINI